MRFDDRIATVLAQPETDLSALKAKWHQLVDLVAQSPPAMAGPERELALQFLRRHRDRLVRSERDRIAASLVGRMPADLARALAAPEPLSQSRDAPVPRNPAAQKAEAHIRELVERLDAFRKRTGEQPDPPASNEPARNFRWETASDGAILWVDGAPRGPLVGQAISSTAAPGHFGVDGQAAGAFRRRAPFRDARFRVAGSGPASGDWRISGVPFFDPKLGTFLGYRGSARRPRMDEIAAMPSAALAADGLFGTELQPDALRQLIHELRTPLNAVLGFAEMIDGQYLGPAGEGYRTRAQAIREEAGRMLTAVDDLDTAARIETSRFPVEESNLDLAVLLVRLHADYARVAHHRNSVLEIAAAPDLPQAKVEPLTAERMCARLLAATIGLAGAGERLLATISAEPIGGREMLCLAITRPSAIAGHEEAELLDPGYTPEGDWPDAPALGLGFALRLVRNLAEAVGGTLTIAADRFLLHLPAAVAATQRSGEGP